MSASRGAGVHTYVSRKLWLQWPQLLTRCNRWDYIRVRRERRHLREPQARQRQRRQRCVTTPEQGTFCCRPRTRAVLGDLATMILDESTRSLHKSGDRWRRPGALQIGSGSSRIGLSAPSLGERHGYLAAPSDAGGTAAIVTVTAALRTTSACRDGGARHGRTARAVPFGIYVPSGKNLSLVFGNRSRPSLSELWGGERDGCHALHCRCARRRKVEAAMAAGSSRRRATSLDRVMGGMWIGHNGGARRRSA